jgi:hypothetical protein
MVNIQLLYSIIRQSLYSDGIKALCDKLCEWVVTGRWFPPGAPVFSTNRTDRHKITEILLKETLNAINQTSLSSDGQHLFII